MPKTQNRKTLTMNRRDFLRGSVAIGGILASQSFPGIVHAENLGKDTLNVAIIGTGEEGRVLLNACRGIPNIRFKAVCDIWEYNRRRGYGVLRGFKQEPEQFSDFEDMLHNTPDLDAAIVATPDFVHHKHAIGCMKAGLNVYCEKLMSNSLEKAKEMVRVSRETGKLLQIGHQRRSNPRYRFAYNTLLKKINLCGRLTAVNAQWNRAVSNDLGWPKKYPIDQATLEKYGYKNMHEFRNWRWYKKYGGGPISDLGAHQIDIFNWWLGGNPVSVMAGGGSDFYKNHEWEDNAMVIYEYMTEHGIVRAFYQVQTTTSAGGGYFEYFMGVDGSIKMSENPRITRIFREAAAPSWNRWVAQNLIANFDPKKKIDPWQLPKPQNLSADDNDDGKVDVRETSAPDEYRMTVELNKPIHQPHLENFFGAVRGENKLNCPGEVGLASAATVLAVHDAIKEERKLKLNPERFTA